jgi:uncharacterized protein YukE
MYELVGPVAMSGELEQARNRLRVLSERVADAVQSAPRRDASGWDGLAAHAYQHALDRLARELEGSQELLRSATDLLSAALFELGAHG